MKTPEEFFEELRSSNTDFNRGKAEELLTNTQIQSQLHSRFAMLKQIGLRGKILLSAGAALILSAGHYAVSVQSAQENITAKSNQTSSLVASSDPDEREAYITIVMPPPEGYPDNIQQMNDKEVNEIQNMYNVPDVLSSLTVIELTQEQYSTLGIEMNDNTLSWYHTDPKTNRGGFFFTLSADGTLSSETDKALDIRGTRSIAFRPRMITDTLGFSRYTSFRYQEVNPTLDSMEKKYRKYNSGNTEKPIQKTIDSVYKELLTQSYNLFNPKNLVPILVRSNKRYSGSSKRWLPDVLVWYDATPEFLAALPKNAIRRPLGAGNDRSGMTFDLRSPSERANDSLQAVFDITIYPNPVTDRRTTAEFSIHHQEYIRIDLTDIGGSRQIPLDEEATYMAGKHRVPLNLPALSNGVYLIVIRTRKGVIRSEQLVVQN